MTAKPHILIIDDDASLGEVLTDILEEAGYRVCTTGNGQDALEKFRECAFQSVLLDLLLPGLNGLEILEQLKVIDPLCPVIMMSGHGTIKSAVEATQKGAFDWMEKPLEKERVLITVRNAVEQAMLAAERAYFHDEIRSRYEMVGSSEQMQPVYSLIDRVAPTHSTVLINGESGTGKELVARAVHMHSSRAGQPFVEVNCAAVPETLIESELFGHVKGAFTGALRDKRGKFMMAQDGTLFLDEIGELSAAAQAKLLRVLESGEISPVGKEVCCQVDVRIIAATNKDLKQRVREGLFREDLFHRINVITISIPPLRERRDDILPILTYYTDLFTAEYRMEPKQFLPDAEAVLLAYEWPGNVRELKNFAEKLIVLVGDSLIGGRHVSQILMEQRQQPFTRITTEAASTFKAAKISFEKHFLMQALERRGWNVTQTAAELDMPRSLLYKKMEKYKLK
ncbi:sigma-54-dependent Fis family transcriptional regulator [bacterium]|nr:sigma-54-dependent Fis family transcriptional regulator [bacterium]